MEAGMLRTSICSKNGTASEGSESSENDGLEWKLGFTVVVEQSNELLYQFRSRIVELFLQSNRVSDIRYSLARTIKRDAYSKMRWRKVDNEGTVVVE